VPTGCTQPTARDLAGSPEFHFYVKACHERGGRWPNMALFKRGEAAGSGEFKERLGTVEEGVVRLKVPHAVLGIFTRTGEARSHQIVESRGVGHPSANGDLAPAELDAG